MLRIGAASSLIAPMVSPGKVEFQYAELSTVAEAESRFLSRAWQQSYFEVTEGRRREVEIAGLRIGGYPQWYRHSIYRFLSAARKPTLERVGIRGWNSFAK